MQIRSRQQLLEAIKNPKSAIDLAQAALDPNSFYNQMLTLLIMKGVALCMIAAVLEVYREALSAKEEAEQLELIEEHFDKLSAKHMIASRDAFNQKHGFQEKPAPAKSIFELEAMASILQERLRVMEEKIPVYHETLEKGQRVLKKVDQEWGQRQSDEAAGFVVSINDQLVKNKAGFSLKMKPSLAKKLEQAYIAPSPVKVLKVNPVLQANPALNADYMENFGNFERTFKVLTEIGRYKQEQDKLQDQPEEEYFPKPSELKKLDKLVQVKRLTLADRKDINTTLATNRVMGEAEAGLREVEEVQKALNRVNDDIRVMKSRHVNGRAAPAA